MSDGAEDNIEDIDVDGGAVDSPDFEDDDFDDVDFDDFEGNESLGGLSRDNPMVKIGIVLGAFVAIVGGIILFGGGEKTTTAPSMVSGGAREDVVGTPGDKVSEAMERAIVDKNQERVEIAKRERGSAIPTPIDTDREEIVLDVEEEGVEEDPLERWRKIQEERQKQQAEIDRLNALGQGGGGGGGSVTIDGFDENAAAEKRQQSVEALASAMAEQMQALLEAQAIDGMQYITITKPEDEEDGSRSGERAGGRSDDEGGAGDTEEVVENILIPAGTIEYAQTLIEANTDAPGPVLAQLASGPLAGSRLIGSFTAEREYLILEFNTIVVDGISRPITAVALDPDTTLPGLATDVNKRYFRRIVIPAASAFITGMASAIAEAGSTTVSTSGDTVATEENDLDARQELFKGLEEAAAKVEEVLDDETSNVNVMIRVAAGTPMALLFIEPVTEPVANVNNN